jgi:hypothetical protein
MFLKTPVIGVEKIRGSRDGGGGVFENMVTRIVLPPPRVCVGVSPPESEPAGENFQ